MNGRIALAAFLCGSIAFAALTPNDSRRPYEIVEAGRVADENAPPLVPFCDTAGWTVETSNAVASLVRSTERLLFGDGVAKLTYRATGTGTPSITVRPPAAAAVTGGFDTVTCWIYGNNFNGKSPPGTPSVSVSARFTDATGRPLAIPLAHVHHKEWSLFRAQVPAARRADVSAGGAFDGLEISGGTNLVDRTIFFSSLCAFKERRGPLSFAKRPKRNVKLFANQPQGANTGDGRLPFPTVETTVVPVVEEDGDLEFRFPGDGEGWDALAFRYRRGEWITIAHGGGMFPKAAGANANVKFRRIGNSAVADILAEGGGVEEVRFGSMALPGRYELIPIPYYTYLKLGGNSRPYVISTKVDGTPIFISCTMDWTQSNASEPFPAGTVYGDACAANGGVRYNPRTDGVRNTVCERFVWTVSTNFQQALPVIPNPASPWRHVAGTHAWRHHGRDKLGENDRRYWRDIRRKGIRHVLATDHETMWRDGFESFSFRTKPAPAKGGDKGLCDYARFLIDELGYRYGPYNNFTDLAPVNAHWRSDNVLLTTNGNWKESWARCYSPKPLYGVEKCLDLTPQIQAKFGFNTGYCDVHTCVSPWGRTDYDARVPGAGTFAQTFYAYGEILLAQKNVWNGPVLSEGGMHWMYAGLSDGNYAQETTYLLEVEPWLVDFDLLRIHPLCCNYGVGMPYMFYRRGRPKGGRWDFVDPFIACTVAFGHAPILLEGENEAYSYFMLQALAAAYAQADVADIRYLDEKGVPLDTSAAVSSGAYKRSQIITRYADGTFVAVNGDRAGRAMTFRFNGETVELPKYGFLGVATNAVSFSGHVGGKRASFAKGPEYFYLCARSGDWVETPHGGTDGEIVRFYGKDGTEEVVASGATEIMVPYRVAKIVALDRKGREIGNVAHTTEADGQTRFKTAAGAYSYRVVRRVEDNEPCRIVVEPDVAVGPVKPVNGVGQPPMVGALKDWPMMHYLKEAGIPYSRLHDVGGRLGGGLYVDIPNIFPDFDADEDDPASYRFVFTDSLMKALVANGVEPFFRLGVTIENWVGYPGRFPALRSVPPKDFAKWGRICEHVIRHYTEGWANGFRMKVEYWEIWNEPEGKAMFDAPFEEYVRLYGTVAPYLKEKFPHLKIGGYGSCGFYAGVNAKFEKAAAISPDMKRFVECARKFLAAARDNKWPLDFFSFHSYSTPRGAIRQVCYADRLLDEFGFTRDRTKRVFNEWLPYPGLESLGSALQAAGIAAELIGLQNGPCDVACIYDARCGVGMFSPLFNPLTQKPHKAYWSFVAFNELRKRGTAVKVEVEGDVPVYATAARGADNSIAVMLANVGERERPFTLDVGGAGRAVRHCHVIDKTRTWKDMPLPAALPPRSVLLVEFGSR